jgi:TolB-like protein/tetratricopeptide (TPR) repeat protein
MGAKYTEPCAMTDRAESENPGNRAEVTAAPARALFISYASHDAEVAQKVCSALEAAGSPCWMAPRDVKPGAQYADAIVRAINEAQAVVVVLSAGAVASSHVGREVERASSKHKQIIAFRLDAATLSPALEYFLGESQWIDVPALGMPAALIKLAKAVGHGPIAPAQQIQATKHAGQTKMRIAIAAVILVCVGAATAVGVHFWSLNHREAQPVAAATIIDKSIAVLPFVDMSEKKDQEYFGDGMAEEIIDLLAKVPDLRVPARTSSFYFKGKPTKIPDIARELGVTNVLEGSIRRSGNRLRVTAQLVRADSGYHLWSETYDRPLDDVFKLQDDIANAVVQALQIRLMGGPLTRRRGGTQNLEAYQLYLRALSSMLQATRTSLMAARDDFNQAIKVDPGFGLAWAELSRDTLFLTNIGVLSPREGYEQARQLARHALQLSPDLAEAHGTLANVHRNYDWDWAASAAEVRQALELDPTNPAALTRAGQLSYTLGRWDDAERQLRLALVRDPLFTVALWSLGTAQYCAGRFAEADTTYRRVLELAPGFILARPYLGKTLLAEGKPEAALAMVQTQDNENASQLFLPILLQAAGHQPESDEALKTLITKFGDSQAYYVAMTYAYRDNRDLALQWLERAFKQKEQKFVEIVGEPLFKNLANDLRYKAFLKKMNLPE